MANWAQDMKSKRVDCLFIGGDSNLEILALRVPTLVLYSVRVLQRILGLVTS